jgi:hypothetical protein
MDLPASKRKSRTTVRKVGVIKPTRKCGAGALEAAPSL